MERYTVGDRERESETERWTQRDVTETQRDVTEIDRK